jgi:hypothetical protein
MLVQLIQHVTPSDQQHSAGGNESCEALVHVQGNLDKQ